MRLGLAAPFTTLSLLALLLVSPSAAQQEMRGRLLPITAPIRHAGVFHVATGTWTRGASLANVTGPDTIYNNSCSPVYFVGMISNDEFQHRSRLPSLSGPSTDSRFYAGPNSAHESDEEPGCRTEYVVNGYQFSYCSSHVGPWDRRDRFASSWIPSAGSSCGLNNLVSQYTIVITGLPGGTATGGQQCWVIDVDLDPSGTGGGIALSADGDGSYTGPGTAEQFGWGFGPVLTPIVVADFTGPVVAGNFTWTGGPYSGVLSPCTGTDGTIWDPEYPSNGSESGTGMLSNNFFRSTYQGPPGGPNCYFFGGVPHADFYLRLFADAGCPPDSSQPFCFPSMAGVRSCPCGNPPSAQKLGCDSFVGPSTPSGNGGAKLATSGTAHASASTTLVFHVTKAHNPTSNSNLHVFWRGTSFLVSGVKSGFGVSCVGGSLARIYQGTGRGTGGLGSTNAVDFPNAAQTTDAWTASGMPSPGTTLLYFDSFRDAQGPANCSTANDRFNVSHAAAVTWVP